MQFPILCSGLLCRPCYPAEHPKGEGGQSEDIGGGANDFPSPGLGLHRMGLDTSKGYLGCYVFITLLCSYIVL